MRRKIIMDENRWLLEAISEEYETIGKHAERIPKIEIDILMENVRKFYENLRILQRLEDPHLSEEPLHHPPAQPVSRPEPREIRPDEKPSQIQQPQVKAVPGPAPSQAPKPPTLLPTPTPPAVVQPPAPTRPVMPEPQVKKPEPRKASRLQEIDLFAQEEITPLSVKLQDARDRAFSPKIPGNRIDNLKMAIPINDKFMFINELFDGNLREYNETIEALNGFKTLDQAAEYLDLMKRKNLWNTASTAFLKLKELVERHY